MFADAGAKRARLRKMKTIATSLLGVMAIVFIASSRLKPAYPFLAWVEAFSEAPLIGGPPTGSPSSRCSAGPVDCRYRTRRSCPRTRIASASSSGSSSSKVSHAGDHRLEAA
jgi:hypothetical protein